MTGTTGMRCRRRRWSWSMCAPSRWASPRRRRRRRSRAGRPPRRAVAAVAPGWPRRPSSPTPTSSTARRSAPARGSRGPRSSRCRPRRSWWRRASPSRSIGTARSWWRDDETSWVKPEARHGCAGARPSAGGCGGPSRGPPTTIDEPSCGKPEARHGCAGARPSAGGGGGPSRGPPRRTMTRPIDPVFASVLERRLRAVTEEMGLTLLRTTRSPILSQARDFVTGLYGPRGEIWAQSEYIPILAFALQPACRAVIAAFEGDVHPGDVFLHNDVFSGGNQNNDVAVFRPIFVDGRLVAWAATKGHQADIGGAQAGGYTPRAPEVWQEALRIPPLRVVDRGTLRRDVWRMLFANVRLPIVEEDIRAQIGGTVMGERGVVELYRRSGAERVESHLAHLFDAAERRMRAELARIPDGVYTGESVVFDDGHHEGSRHPIRVTITARGGELSLDYTGTAPQTVGFVNAPLASSYSAVLLTVLMLGDPQIAHNEQILRALRVDIPRGTLLNADFPAATTFGNTLAGPHSDAIFRALADALPDRVSAGWNRMLGMTVAGTDPRRRRRYVDILFLALKGGSGAVRGCDGDDHIGLTNTAGRHPRAG